MRIFNGASNEAEKDDLEKRVLELEGRIAELEKENRKLNESKNYFQVTLKSIGDAVITTDDKGRVTGLNPVAEELTGWQVERAIGQPIEKILRLVNTLTGEPADNPVRKVLKTGKVVGLASHTKLITSERKEFHIADSAAPILDENGILLGVIIVFRDITLAQQVRDSLKKSQEQFFNIFENSPVPISLSLYPGNKLTEVNQAWCNMFSFTRDEVLGKDPGELEIEERETRQYLSDLFNRYGEVDNEEISLQTSNGSRKNVLCTIKLIQIDDQAYNLNTFIDITDKNRADAERKERELLYSLLVEQVSDSFFVHDDTGAFMEINDQACKALGYTREELLEMNVCDIEQNYTPETAKEVWTTISPGMPVTMQGLLKRKDGSLFPAEVHFGCSYLKTKKVFLGLVQDITERQNAERLLKESELKFRNAFGQHSAIKFLINPETSKIIDANQAAADFYGWPIEVLRTMNVSEINPRSSKDIAADLKKVRDKKANYFEFVHRKADGSFANVEVYSSQIDIEGKSLVHAIVHDITEKKKAEFKLKLLEYSVEQNPVGILISDIKGEIVYVNSSFELLSGYRYEEVAGAKLENLDTLFAISGEQRTQFRSRLLSGEKTINEYKSRKKNGEAFWLKLMVSPIRDSSAQITHYVVVMEDITDRKQIMDELIEAKIKAEESDRLKSAFLANMSHEIRTPMNGILGFTDLLENTELSGDQKLRYLKIIRQSGERMLETVNDLIDISRIETGQMPFVPGKVNIGELLESTYSFFLPMAAKKGLTLSIENKLPGSMLVEADKAKLESILTNLVRNAVKFTDEGGIVICSEVKESELLISVMDTGIGIPESSRETIFNRFEQTDEAYRRAIPGSGLGLSIARAFAEMHEGRLWVEDNPEGGSVFHFAFRLKVLQDEMIDFPADEILKEVRHTAGKYKVIIAEDDESSSYYMSQIIGEICSSIKYARTGLEAVELCRNFPDTDLVLMDIRLPELDGYEATKRIREFNDKVVIFAQTAYAMLADKARALEAGCTDYLSKPVLKEKLFELINKHLVIRN